MSAKIDVKGRRGGGGVLREVFERSGGGAGVGVSGSTVLEVCRAIGDILRRIVGLSSSMINDKLAEDSPTDRKLAC
jgi:hypothetical protein